MESLAWGAGDRTGQDNQRDGDLPGSDLLEYFRPVTQLTNGGQSLGDPADKTQPSDAAPPVTAKAS